ncbi:MAG TPA: 30S ribosomal protein S15 [Candidatus Nanoarchaeia archaeon]|nr:30S ribosomal protein S15 [Candidatus Nanoarchaeia archaeon]
MARMHSRKRGQSGSKKPAKKVPSWAPFKEKEVEKLIVKYSKAGKTTSEVGMILRDSYGIHSVKALTGKSISAVTQENKLGKALPEDMTSLIRRMIEIKQHFDKNKQDMTALRGLQLTEAKIRRLVKYYKRSKRLALDWQFDTDRLKMYLE